MLPMYEKTLYLDNDIQILIPNSFNFPMMVIINNGYPMNLSIENIDSIISYCNRYQLSIIRQYIIAKLYINYNTKKLYKEYANAGLSSDGARSVLDQYVKYLYYNTAKMGEYITDEQK